MRPHLSSADIPSALWPSDNVYGIPVLDVERQADIVDAPVSRWGRETRKSRMRGTWHFYTDDYRFSALWARPQHLTNSGCVAAIECNFSVHAQTPRAVAIYRTFQKRYLARLWQAHGVRIVVDLNVAAEHAETNLLGVPPGWRSYATRGAVERLDDLEREYASAAERAGCAPTFLVYGGGKAVRAVCERRGWIWIPEEADRRRAWVADRAQAVEAAAGADALRLTFSPHGQGPTA